MRKCFLSETKRSAAQQLLYQIEISVEKGNKLNLTELEKSLKQNIYVTTHVIMGRLFKKIVSLMTSLRGQLVFEGFLPYMGLAAILIM